MVELNNKPIISVCMPCYNDEGNIKECVESVLDQSFQNFELLIADDGSTDKSIEIIETFKDKRIKLFKQNHNYIGNLNFLIEKSQGKYIARMDSDDVMLKDRLLIQYNYMEHHKHIDVLGGGMDIFGKREGVFLPLLSAETITPEQMYVSNPLAHPTVMMRKAIFDNKDLKYEQEYIYAEDYRLWVKMLMAGISIDNIQTVLIRYRTSYKQNSVQYSEKQKTVTKKIQEEIKEYWKLNAEE